MPSGVHSTPVTHATHGARRIRIAARSPLWGGRAARTLLCLLPLLVAAPQPPGWVPALVAQTGGLDADLAAASRGRTVRIGAGTGVARVTTTIPLEVYVARVIAGEGEPNAPAATYQALAVAIRTYAIANAGRHRREGFDLCDTTHCQVPRAATVPSRQAALATAGQVLTYEGTPAEVFYSASCGGHSESAAQVWPGANLPYLRAVIDDVHDDDEPWTLELSLSQIRSALGRVGFAGRRLTDVEVEVRSESGRASRLRLAGLRPDAIAGEPFRAAVGARALRSTAFSVQRQGQTIRFTGRGYGHGVGMCVIGAGRRARRGETVEDILRAYYPGLDLVPLDSLPPGTGLRVYAGRTD
jgi:stage II sporulation protein D